MTDQRNGPLANIKVLELGGVGPVPFCGMHFADLGADVIRIERPLADDDLSRSRRSLNLVARGKRTIGLDLRVPESKVIADRLIARADVVLEGFRSGTVERMGLGPHDARKLNPGIVYGRMSGWGNNGPLGSLAGHDINYLSLSGLLSTIGPKSLPMPPLNIVGDFGGALYLVTGVLSALICAKETGKPQTVDASIMGGSIALMAQLFTISDAGNWANEREANWMDGGAPYYRCYETADKKFMAVGAVEPKFFANLVALLELEDEVEITRQTDKSYWPSLVEFFTAVFARKTRDEWTRKASGIDACCTPVLDLDEARSHPQALENGMFVEVGDRIEPSPQPYFADMQVDAPRPASAHGADAAEILTDIGFSSEDIELFFNRGVVSRP